jgi:hypothetical protein
MNLRERRGKNRSSQHRRLCPPFLSFFLSIDPLPFRVLPVEKGLAAEHGGELLADALKHLSGDRMEKA